MIVHVRIDERLAHGQVCVRWVNELKASDIIVLDNGTAEDPFLKRIVVGSAPVGKKISVYASGDSDLAEMKRRFHDDPDVRAMIVTKTPANVLKLMNAGFSQIDSVTIGNMGGGNGRKQVTPQVWISAGEKEDVRRLIAMGLRVVIRQTPDNSPVDVSRLID